MQLKDRTAHQQQIIDALRQQVSQLTEEVTRFTTASLLHALAMPACDSADVPHKPSSRVPACQRSLRCIPS